jgi:hypothetical protein
MLCWVMKIAMIIIMIGYNSGKIVIAMVFIRCGGGRRVVIMINYWQ